MRGAYAPAESRRLTFEQRGLALADADAEASLVDAV
jgi:hypothetical protein